jgi:hypothetical protein
MVSWWLYLYHDAQVVGEEREREARAKQGRCKKEKKNLFFG